MNKTKVRISDYTKFPGGRFPTDGEGNATEFRNKFLVPHLNKGYKIVVNLDGVIGYPASFLEEVFGGLVRTNKFTADFINSHIEFKTHEPGNLITIEMIKKYIKSPDDLEWMKIGTIVNKLPSDNNDVPYVNP